jgi:RiboL-PSP-HEPN
MPYSDHFKLADDLITHLDGILTAVHDPFLESRYVGFVAVSSVTVLELALKNIFNDFAETKHGVFGVFCTSYFARINGRIGLRQIREEYTIRFGEKYRDRFTRKLDQREKEVLVSGRYSLKASYGNLIQWRNDFAHEGNIPATPTYAEVKSGYNSGKEVMHCLAASMRR